MYRTCVLTYFRIFCADFYTLSYFEPSVIIMERAMSCASARIRALYYSSYNAATRMLRTRCACNGIVHLLTRMARRDTRLSESNSTCISAPTETSFPRDSGSDARPHHDRVPRILRAFPAVTTWNFIALSSDREFRDVIL